jgi:hypothetical protein
MEAMNSWGYFWGYFGFRLGVFSKNASFPFIHAGSRPFLEVNFAPSWRLRPRSWGYFLREGENPPENGDARQP